MSFYLSRMLGLDNVPLVMLSRVNSSAPFWREVEGDIQKAEWDEGTLVALISWIDELSNFRR